MVNNNNLNATPSSSLSSMSGSTNTNTNTSTSSPNKNNIMKGFLKRKPFRSPASSSTTTTSSHTNNNTNYNNYNTNGMTKKKSNETLEEAYHRLKRNSNNKNNNDNEQSQFQLEQRSIFLTSTSTSSSDSQTQSESHHHQQQQQEQQKQHNYDDVQSTTTTTTTTTMTKSTGPRKAMSKDSIIKDESKLRKILIRLISGILMVGIFVSTMFCGHLYICSLIFLTEILLFRELLTVRYNTFFHIIEETIPLFRTTQWMWFVTAIVYTYSDFVVEVIKSNTSLHHLLHYARFNTIFSFLLYSATFVVSIATMHKDHIRFQLNQLCWSKQCAIRCTIVCTKLGSIICANLSCSFIFIAHDPHQLIYFAGIHQVYHLQYWYDQLL